MREVDRCMKFHYCLARHSIRHSAYITANLSRHRYEGEININHCYPFLMLKKRRHQWTLMNLYEKLPGMKIKA